MLKFLSKIVKNNSNNNNKNKNKKGLNRKIIN